MDTHTHTHTHVLTAEFFSQTRRLSWIPYTLSHSSPWTWPLILPSPPHHLFFYFNLVHAVPDELRTLCSGIKTVPTPQNICYLLQASIWKQSHKSNYLPWKSSTPQVHQLPFYSSSRTLQTAQFCSQSGYASQLSNGVLALQACQRWQQLTHLKNNANWQNTNPAITPYPWLQPFSAAIITFSLPSLERRHHSAYNPSSACSRNADVMSNEP